MEKTCTRCKETKPLTEFRKNSRQEDGHEVACKACRKKYDNETYKTDPIRRKAIRESNDRRRLELMIKYRAYLNEHPCVDCGQVDPELLECDHVRGDKFKGVGELVRICASWKTILEEIAKCEVRCLYCHRKRTIKQLGWYALLVQ